MSAVLGKLWKEWREGGREGGREGKTDSELSSRIELSSQGCFGLPELSVRVICHEGHIEVKGEALVAKCD